MHSELMDNLIEKFKPISGFFYKIKRYILNIIAYTPILWHDRDFDHMYILTMLKYKLKRTRECIVKNNIISNVEEVGKEIGEAEYILTGLIEDNFCNTEIDIHEAKWGETKFEFEAYSPNPALGKKLKITHINAISPEEIEQEQKESEVNR